MYSEIYPEKPDKTVGEEVLEITRENEDRRERIEERERRRARLIAQGD